MKRLRRLLVLWLAVMTATLRVLVAKDVDKYDMVVERYDNNATNGDNIIDFYLGDLFSTDYLSQERTRMEATMKDPSQVIGAKRWAFLTS